MNPFMRPYFMSKWVCPYHGYFWARTDRPVDQNRPLACPECTCTLISQCPGHTTQSVPYISKPRRPIAVKGKGPEPRSSGNTPLRKRGVFC